VDTLEARQTTRAYGRLWHGSAEAGPYPPAEDGPIVRHATEDIGGVAAPCGPVRVLIDVGAPGARPLELPLAAGTELVLGSGAAADVRIDDPTVSARHCRLAHVGTHVELTDLGAKNGVRVGGVRVSRAALTVGTACEIGRTVVRIHPGIRRQKEGGPPLRGLVGSSAAMRTLADAVRQVAPLRLPALLRGESGTGKDLVARAVHDESPRAGQPFVVLNAAAISRELAESELFGHARGAFTGAVRDRRGAFREAHGGTLFLDEIGAVPLDVQAKLLRAVEEGLVRPVGGESPVPVDVRLVAATCEPLETLVSTRRFRADLYERLAVCVVRVPALRDRLDDIPALVRHLLASSEIEGCSLSPDAVAALRSYRWPGNVRELRNVVVQAAVRARGRIEAMHVAAVLGERAERGRRLAPLDALRVWEEAGRNVSEAARRVDLPRTTMRDLLRAAGVPAMGKGAGG
jgi:DNA-binding NtrC family response regulator